MDWVNFKMLSAKADISRNKSLDSKQKMYINKSELVNNCINSLPNQVLYGCFRAYLLTREYIHPVKPLIFITRLMMDKICLVSTSIYTLYLWMEGVYYITVIKYKWVSYGKTLFCLYFLSHGFSAKVCLQET